MAMAEFPDIKYFRRQDSRRHNDSYASREALLTWGRPSPLVRSQVPSSSSFLRTSVRKRHGVQATPTSITIVMDPASPQSTSIITSAAVSSGFKSPLRAKKFPYQRQTHRPSRPHQDGH